MSQSTVTNRELLTPQPVTPTSAAPPATQQPNLPRRITTRWQRLGSAIPTLAVVAALAALAGWGHSTDWTLPKFSALMGNGVTKVKDWCEEHGVPDSQCIECNPTLAPRIKDYGWCKEHGIAQCPLEHPDVAQLKTIPVISSDDIERANRAIALRPRAENNARCLLQQRRIQFASTEALEKTGVDIAVVGQHPVIEAVVANGEVIYDETHAAQLASRVPGTVWRVEKQVGDRVQMGDILALVDAAEVGRAKGEFLQSIAKLRLTKATFERLTPLSGGAVPARVVREAEVAFQEAQIRLMSAQQSLINLGFTVHADDFSELDTDEVAKQIQFLGLPSATVASFKPDSTTSNLFPLQSPLDGVVVARKAAPGEVVDTTTTLFRVADVSRMWLILDVRQDDAKYLKLGQKVLFRRTESRDEPEITGTLDWISTEADDKTRTVKVRANLPNQDGLLRANTFGTGQIVLREEPKAIVVPSEAVHSDGCCNVVFVRDKDFFKAGAPKFFHIRKVRLGVQNEDTTEIIAGLLPGEVIASKNSVVLEAQLLKSNLGAGCGCGKD